MPDSTIQQPTPQKDSLGSGAGKYSAERPTKTSSQSTPRSTQTIFRLGVVNLNDV